MLEMMNHLFRMTVRDRQPGKLPRRSWRSVAGWLLRTCKFMVPALAFAAQPCSAGEDLITTARDGNGEIVPYVLNYQNLSPRYVIILFPGGNGIVDPHMEDGKIVYRAKGNFLLKARSFIVDENLPLSQPIRRRLRHVSRRS